MEAVDSERLLQFSYTSNKLKTTTRTVEPMTDAFIWRSWYLYAWCRIRQVAAGSSGK
jgi:predicted DNA-binding transcriptional regulator YafY